MPFSSPKTENRLTRKNKIIAATPTKLKNIGEVENILLKVMMPMMEKPNSR
jgi:hypothetical protein